jgi:hypothetical protein
MDPSPQAFVGPALAKYLALQTDGADSARECSASPADIDNHLFLLRYL